MSDRDEQNARIETFLTGDTKYIREYETAQKQAADARARKDQLIVEAALISLLIVGLLATKEVRGLLRHLLECFNWSGIKEFFDMKKLLISANVLLFVLGLVVWAANNDRELHPGLVALLMLPGTVSLLLLNWNAFKPERP